MTSPRFFALSLFLRRRRFTSLRVFSIQYRRGRAEDRPKKFVEVIAAAERSRNSNPSTNNRKRRKKNQRRKHDPWTLMNAAVPMPMCFGIASILSEERHEEQPEHVERADERGNETDKPEDPTRLVRPPEDFVLAEESGERRNA